MNHTVGKNVKNWYRKTEVSVWSGQSFRAQLLKSFLVNTYSMKQPDLYYFEAIKMTSQA